MTTPPLSPRILLADRWRRLLTMSLAITKDKALLANLTKIGNAKVYAFALGAWPMESSKEFADRHFDPMFDLLRAMESTALSHVQKDLLDRLGREATDYMHTLLDLEEEGHITH